MNSFSPNMLKTFKECPKKYFYKYVQKISVPQKATPFEKGKKIHALANYYLRGDDISKFEKMLSQEELSAWDKLKNNEFFNKTYINSEYNLSCRIEDFWIGGRLDALVKDFENYYILDYKTGSVPQDPKMDYQTMIYLLAVAKFLHIEKNLTLVYIDLKNNTNYKIEYSKDLESIYTNELTKTCHEILNEKTFKPNTLNCKFCEYNKLCNIIH